MFDMRGWGEWGVAHYFCYLDYEIMHIMHIMHNLIQLDSGQSDSLSWIGGTRKKGCFPPSRQEYCGHSVMTDMYIVYMHKLNKLDSGQSNSLSWKDVNVFQYLNKLQLIFLRKFMSLTEQAIWSEGSAYRRSTFRKAK